jgi:hypothetical protein
MTPSTIATTAAQNGHHPQAAETLVTSESDEFDTAEFEEGRESLPYLQLLNHQDPNQSGFFITAENMEAAFFVPNEDWTLHTATFQRGETAEGYRSLLARLLILNKSKLMMYDRDSGEFISDYQKVHLRSRHPYPEAALSGLPHHQRQAVDARITADADHQRFLLRQLWGNSAELPQRDEQSLRGSDRGEEATGRPVHGTLGAGGAGAAGTQG